MTMLFCSLSDRPNLSEKIYESNKEYFERYNFKYIFEDKVLNKSRHPAWSKIKLLQREMKNNPDIEYIVWIDDDIIIKNHTINFKDIISKYSFDHILIDDNDNIGGWKLNSGFFVCKNNETTYQILQHIWISAKKDHYWGGVWENDTMNDYYKNLSDTQNEIKIIPHRTIQTFYNRYKDGEFAIHFAGMKNQEKRIQLINNHLKKIIK